MANKDWHMYSKPEYYGPSKPIKPKKTVQIKQKKVIKSISGYEIFNLSEIALPSGVDYKDLLIELNGDEAEVEIFYYIVQDLENTNYDSQMKSYHAAVERHKNALLKHQKEVEEWKVWSKEEKEKELQNQLDMAEDLLKKHGRI